MTEPTKDSTDRLFEAITKPTPQSARDVQPARELDVAGLRGVIQEGVNRGVMKAVAVYALISLLVWIVISLVVESNRYN